MAEHSYASIGLTNGMNSSEQSLVEPNHPPLVTTSETATVTSYSDVDASLKSEDFSESGIVVGELIIPEDGNVIVETIIPEKGNVYVETFSQNGRSFELTSEFAGMGHQDSPLVICEDSFRVNFDSSFEGSQQSNQGSPNHNLESVPEYHELQVPKICNVPQTPTSPEESSLLSTTESIPVHKEEPMYSADSQYVNCMPVAQSTPVIPSTAMGSPNVTTPVRPAFRASRNKLLTSQLLSPDEIVREVIEQAERKRPPQIPEGGDLLFQKQLTKRLANKVVKDELLERKPPTSVPPPKPCTDAEALRLLSILEDNEGQEKEKEVKESRGRGRSRASAKPPIDRQMERELALKQLMEVSRKRVRRMESNNNEEKDKEKDKEKEKEKTDKPLPKKMKPELKRLLQDEGAINMLYDVEHGNKMPEPGRRSSKKSLNRKAQEVEEALLGSGGRRKPRLRKAQKAQASKIVRRHSSSSSYSSRGSSPARRSSVEENGELSKSLPPPVATSASLLDVSLEIQGSQADQPDSNGFKEKLQSEFSNKFKSIMVKKAILSVKREQQGVEPHMHPIAKSPQTSSMSPSKASDSVWKMLQDDWQLEEDHPAPSTPSPAVPVPNSGSASVPTLVKPSPPSALSPQIPSKHTEPSPIKTEIAPLPAAEPQVDSFTDINEVPFTHRLGNYEYKELLIRQIGPLIHVKIAPVSTFLPQALNVRVLKELSRALDEVSAGWSGCRVLLLTSSSNVFSTGVDLPALLSDEPLGRTAAAREMSQSIKDFIFKLGMLKRPVIAGVEGPCIGLGMGLLAFCDLVYATSNATFYMPHGILGYSPEGAATLTLPVFLGYRQMVSMLMVGERLGANRARECGFLTEVFPDEDFTVKVVHRAYDLAIKCPEMMEMTKAQYMGEIRSKLSTTLLVETNRLQIQWQSPNCQLRIKQHADRLLTE